MNVQFNFQGRHVVVFGGTTGINLGIAQAYAAAGAKVSVASRKQANVDAAGSTLGAHGFGVVADVRDDDSVTAALALAGGGLLIGGLVPFGRRRRGKDGADATAGEQEPR